MLVDSHTHLEQYPDYELDAILARSRDARVQAIFLAGTTVLDSHRTAYLASQYRNLFAGVGVPPTEVFSLWTPHTLGELEAILNESNRVLAISEIGLDFTVPPDSFPSQYSAFREQIELARKVDLPIIFHSREDSSSEGKHDETLRLLREEKAWEVGGIMHYFQASRHVADQCLDLGFYISLGKPLLRSTSLQETAREIPLNSIVLETDSYPQPFKARRELWTEPKDVLEVATKLADIRRITLEEVAYTTTQNMLRLYAKASRLHLKEMLSSVLED